MTKLEATHKWVEAFNEFQTEMIRELWNADYEGWREITYPEPGDCVYVYELSNGVSTSDHRGKIVSYDTESDSYAVELADGVTVYLREDEFDVERDDGLPSWGTIWQFNDSIDNWWLEHKCNLLSMSACGFRIYESDKFGLFFGIDGAGYNFYEHHWLPLYDARGLKWHDKEEIA